MDPLMELFLEEQRSKSKIFHLEAFVQDYAYIGTDIKADSLDEAELILKSVFGSAFPGDDPEIYCLSEEWVH